MPLKVTIVAGLLLLSGNGFSQKNETDSLEALVKSALPDTAKVRLLNALVSSLREKDNNKAFVFAAEAKDLADSLKDRKGLSKALENFGWILYRKGDFSESLDISTQALKVSEEINDKAAMARSQINISAIHYEQEQYPQAIESLRKAYLIAHAIDDRLTMARCYNNIAYTFINLKAIDSAYINVKRALLISEAEEDPYMIAFARRTLGDIYLLKNKTPEALHNFDKCLLISVAHSNTFLKASVLHRLAKTYATLGQYDKALAYLNENVQIAKEFGFKDALERAYKMYSEIYFHKNDLAKAYAYQSAYIEIHDSLYNQRSSEQIALMQIRFDSEMKQAQIELLTKDAALQAEEIDRQRAWIYFYVGCLSLLAILAFLLLYNNHSNRKAKLALQEKNKAIETQTHQLRNLNATKDKLFSIISHDLRSPVASLRALMEMLSKAGLSQAEFVDITNALKRNLDSVYDDLDNLLLWAQTQLKGLQAYPEKFDLRKLAEEKIELFNDPATNKNIEIINTIPHGMAVLADRNHVNLIFRNLIANAIKFNQPGGSIKISALEKAGFNEITVTDSGIGISLEDIDKLFCAETHFTKPGTNKEKGAGIGLLLTKEFVESNQGSIWVTSKIGKGTTFTFTLKTAKQPVFAYS